VYRPDTHAYESLHRMVQHRCHASNLPLAAFAQDEAYPGKVSFSTQDGNVGWRSSFSV
jgi:hypothetical protein